MVTQARRNSGPDPLLRRTLLKSMSQSKSDLKKLEDKWNKILTKSGLQDIEETKGNEKVLKQVSSHAYWRENGLTAESKLTYYNILSHKVQTEKFDSALDKLVMFMAAQGMSHASIVRILTSIGQKKHRTTVNFIIRRYEMEWGLKTWTLKQMNLKPPTK